MYETNYTEEMSEKINRYLYLILIDLIEKYNRGEYLSLFPIEGNVDFEGKIPVWVCWWQGINNAPELVEKCVESIYRHIPQDIAKIHFINFENYMNYVAFSETIVNRFNKGLITLTHLSDILRVQLLYRYGGLWLDATYFISDDRIKDVFSKEFYTIKYSKPSWSGDVIAKGKWMVNFLFSKKNNPLFGFVMEAFEQYWSIRDDLLDYFLTDRLINVAYENVEKIRNIIDLNPVNNLSSLKLMDCACSPYDEDIWNDMKKDTFAFKMSYKEYVASVTPDGEDTFYGKILNSHAHTETG